MKLIIIFLFAITACQVQDVDYIPIMEYIHENIQYKYDESVEWQTPNVTIELGTGDCEDLATLMLYMVNTAYNIKGELVCVWWDEEHENSHAYAYYDAFYDPVHNVVIEDMKKEIYFIWSYDFTMFMANVF